MSIGADSLMIEINERTHRVTSTGMKFGRKPTWISGPDQDRTLVLHVVGALEYQDGGGSKYEPSRFLVLRAAEESRNLEVVTYDCHLIVEIAGIPKRPRKERAE